MKPALAVCSMLIIFLLRVICVISSFNAYKLTPISLQQYQDNKYIRKEKYHRTRIFSVKAFLYL